MTTEQSVMLATALAYAAQGMPVGWVYGLRRDEESGDLVCTCPDTGTPRCGGPGKHVGVGADQYRGALDFTTDADRIERFPWTDGINIAIGGRECYPIIDIDDPEIAAALSRSEIGLVGADMIASTGRGLHFYLEAAPTRNLILKRKDNGERIGEIRAHGYYVVAPPSLHLTGKRYRWVGPSLLEYGWTKTGGGDGFAYAQRILGLIGVELADKTQSALAPQRAGGIVPIPLPYATRSGTLMDMLAPTHPVRDRSAALVHLGCEVLRDAVLTGYHITPMELAGVVKQVDKTRRHAKGPKYYGRSNADDHYWDIAFRAVAYVIEERKKQEAPPDVPPAESDTPPDGDTLDGTVKGTPTPPPPEYYFSETEGFIDNHDPKKPLRERRIANFEPLILERMISWDKIGIVPSSEETWVVQVRLPGEEPDRIEVPPKAHTGDRPLAAYFKQSMQSHYVIRRGQNPAFEEALQIYSAAHWGGAAPRRRTYGMSGWLPDKEAFLLPGSDGAITVDGIDRSVLWRQEEASPILLQYGYGVEPKECDFASILRALYRLREPAITVPLMAQMWMAPMMSLGAQGAATVLHLQARTGQLKSSLARVALSVYGRFSTVGVDSVTPWGGTTTHRYLTQMLSWARDLPVLFDDWKAVLFNQAELDARLALIQQHGDRGATGRLTRDVKSRNDSIHALLVSTGEDVWDGQESSAARTLIIDTYLPGLDKKSPAFSLDVLTDVYGRFTIVQDMARAGMLGAVGFEYLRWLVRRGRPSLEADIPRRFQEERIKLGTEANLRGAHQRPVDSLAMLLTVSSFFQDFLDEVIPDFAAEYRDMAALAWGQTMLAVAAQSKDATQYTPFEMLVSAVRDGIAINEAYLAPRIKGVDAVGMAGADTVGFIDNERVWFNETATLGWYEERCRRRGNQSTLKWRSFIADAVKDHGGYFPDDAVRVHMSAIGRLRLVGFPREEFFGIDESRAGSAVSVDFTAE